LIDALNRLRRATHLEEHQRSWNARPSFLDQQFHEIIPHHAQRIVADRNVDKDDHLTAQLALKKLEKTKKAKESKAKK
jgi:hypothetical protein